MPRTILRWLLRALALGAFLLAGMVGLFLFGGWREGRDLSALLHAPSVPPLGPKVVLAAGPLGAAQRVGELANRELVEASGLAASRLRDDVLWVHNDHSPRPVIFAAGLDGSDRGSFEIEGATVEDWEDLASFELDGKPYLLVADVGDNAGWRRDVTLYVVAEPVFDGPRLAPGTRVPLAWTTRLRYPDGSRDCESVAVDMQREKVLLLSKRAEPKTLYEVPLRPASTALLVATRLGPMPQLPRATQADVDANAAMGGFAGQPTSMDLLPDGSALVVLTYRDLLLFPRRGDESWATAAARLPQGLMHPPMLQAEAVAFARDGASVFLTGEQRPTPLYRVPFSH